MTEKRRKVKGCWGGGISYSLEDIEFNACIGNFTSQGAKYIIDLFMMFEKGVMPYEGSLSDQPAKLLEAFDMIRSIREQKRLENEQKQKRKSK